MSSAPSPGHEPSSAKRILIVKMWALGDIVMATPILSALRTRWPDAYIAWAIEKQSCDLLIGHPGIDEVVPIDTGQWRRLLRKGNLAGWAQRSHTLRRGMRERRFDIAINFHPEKSWTAILCPAPVRIGMYPSAEPNWTRRLYTTSLGHTPKMHDTRHALRAAEAVGCPPASLALTVGVSDGEAAFLRRFEIEHGLKPDTPLIALAPFSSSETKNWPIEKFAEFARALSARHPAVRCVVTFGPKEREQALDLARSASGRFAPIVPESMGLGDFVALIRRARLVVTGDSSPLHVAAAVGTPYIALFGSTDPAPLAPLSGVGTIIARSLACAPCWSNRCRNPSPLFCLTSIEADDVLLAAEQYLSARQEMKVLQ